MSRAFLDYEYYSEKALYRFLMMFLKLHNRIAHFFSKPLSILPTQKDNSYRLCNPSSCFFKTDEKNSYYRRKFCDLAKKILPAYCLQETPGKTKPDSTPVFENLFYKGVRENPEWILKAFELAFNDLSNVDQIILKRFLGLNFKCIGLPRFIENITDQIVCENDAKKNEKVRDALKKLLLFISRVFQKVYSEQKENTDTNIKTLDFTKSTLMPIDELSQYCVDLEQSKNTISISMKKIVPFDFLGIHSIHSLSELRGSICVIAGIGGGSDVIQAAQLAAEMKLEGKVIPAVISYRENQIGSVATDEKIGSPRKLIGDNNVDYIEIAEGVFRIFRHTRITSGRWFEDAVNDIAPCLLVIDDKKPDTISKRTEIALKYISDTFLEDNQAIDTIYGVDTGGDVFYSHEASTDSSKATPDQDHRVAFGLHKLATKLKLQSFMSIIAPGVDTPHNAIDVIQRSNGRIYRWTPDQARRIEDRYQLWFDDIQHWGKTPLALRAALKQLNTIQSFQSGFQTLPLPERAILSKDNPFIPHVYIQKAMTNVVFVNSKDLLESIGLVSEAP